MWAGNGHSLECAVIAVCDEQTPERSKDNKAISLLSWVRVEVSGPEVKGKHIPLLRYRQAFVLFSNNLSQNVVTEKG